MVGATSLVSSPIKGGFYSLCGFSSLMELGGGVDSDLLERSWRQRREKSHPPPPTRLFEALLPPSGDAD